MIDRFYSNTSIIYFIFSHLYTNGEVIYMNTKLIITKKNAERTGIKSYPSAFGKILSTGSMHSPTKPDARATSSSVSSLTSPSITARWLLKNNFRLHHNSKSSTII